MEERLLERDDSRASVAMAAALVEQAMEGRCMPIEVTYHEDFERAKRAFLWYHRLYNPRALCILTLVGLPFFEIPVWCPGELPNPCGDPVTFQLSGLPYIDRWQSLLIESLCLVMLVGSVALQFYYLGSHFWDFHSAICKVVLLTALIISAAATAFGFEAFQVSMYLRALVPVVFTRSLRVCVGVTYRILHTFADIAVLLGLFILLSAYIATLIFRDTTAEYDNYRSSLLSLFVLLTTANNPNVWADAYTADRRAFFFFFTYLLVGLFFLMNLVFTVIYDNYKAQMATEAKMRTTARQQTLREAFLILDTRKQSWIDGAKMTALLNAMSSYSQLPDSIKSTQEVFLNLDKRGDFRIWNDEFESLCDVIAGVIEAASRRRRVVVPRSSWGGEMLTRLRIPVYERMIWALTLASVVVAICESEVTSIDIKRNLAIPEIVFGWIFVLDVVVKTSVIHGWTKYWTISLNQFDFLMTSLTVITQLAVFFDAIGQHWVSILYLIRGLRICCFLECFRWHLIAQTVVHLIPATAPILALQFTVCTLFSILGVHLFGGKVHLGNRLLEDTDYAAGRLYAFNYNDFAAAMVTSFNLCVVNNWYVIMDAYAVVTGTAWSRAFFVTFWAVAVAFTLNVVVAFFVESFVFRMDKAEKAKVEKNLKKLQASRSRSESALNTPLLRRLPRMRSWYDLHEDIAQKQPLPL